MFLQIIRQILQKKGEGGLNRIALKCTGFHPLIKSPSERWAPHWLVPKRLHYCSTMLCLQRSLLLWRWLGSLLGASWAGAGSSALPLPLLSSYTSPRTRSGETLLHEKMRLKRRPIRGFRIGEHVSHSPVSDKSTWGVGRRTSEAQRAREHAIPVPAVYEVPKTQRVKLYISAKWLS